MSKPVYEIPVNGEEPGVPQTFEPPGVVTASTTYLNAPPPNVAPRPVVPPSEGPSGWPVPLVEPIVIPAPSNSIPDAGWAQPVSPPPMAPPLASQLQPQLQAQPQHAAAPISAPPPVGVPVDIDHWSATTTTATSGADPDLLEALQEVLRAGASDLHVSANSAPMIRVDGGLRAVTKSAAPWDSAKVASALRSLLTEEQSEKFDSELEFDFAYTLSANARFRVNFYQQRNFMGAAFRLIPTEIKQLRDLGVPDTVAQFATLPRGLVLVTGPTGSGKSTTLAALIDLINRTRSDHVMTVEDPIEFIHPNHKSLVNQREVGGDTHSFGAALKHVLRQDPDVILIGELRDLETISVALTAAETGHLVFATLHTQDAAQTVDRIIDVFPPYAQGQVRTQLAATLQGVVCQTLVKRASGKGRVVATEVLVATPAIANLIREGKTYQIGSAMQAGRGLGMQTMDQHLADLVNSGDITSEAALEKVHDPIGFKQLVHRSTPLAAAYGDFPQNFGTV
jgi:twitching motility protein PilT